MGPRSVTADRPCVLAQSWFGALSFNGAAVCHRGSAFVQSSSTGPPARLQWGRGLSPRIGALHTARIVRNQWGFNGAAVCHRGSAFYFFVKRFWHVVASMGPRSVTADRMASWRNWYTQLV